jgi:NAD(P)-dependent dehydrogenase (short-subunit alcohol dehydrogenase family)
VHNHLADVADEVAVRRAAAEVAAMLRARAEVSDSGGGLGKVCVVHCAGVHTKDSAWSLASLAALSGGERGESGVEAMRRTLQVNLVAPALLTSCLLPSLGAGSSVVFVGSTLSEIGVPGHLSYVVIYNPTST